MNVKAIICGLLATTAFGAGAATVAASGVAESKIEPASAGATTRLYLDMSGFADWYSSSASFKVHTWNEANGDKYHAVTKVADAYYYADVDLSTYASGGGYRFTRYNSTGATEWNRGVWQGYGDGVSTYYRASGWTNGTWDTRDQITWQIVGSTTGNWTEQTEDIHINLSFRFDSEGLQFLNTSVSLTKGSVFKIKSSNGDYYGTGKLSEYQGQSANEKRYISSKTTGSDNNIAVNTTGTYEFYVKPNSEEIWVQAASDVEATEWADGFLTATNSICSTGGTSADHLSALSAIWSTQKSAYEGMTQGARSVIKTGTANPTVKDAHDRYVHIVKRYSDLDKFDDGPVVSQSNLLTTVFNNNNSLLAIVLVSVGIISVAALVLIAKKKRLVR